MSKKDIKDGIISMRGDRCELSGEQLPEDSSLFDVHRKTPRCEGGRYTDENTVVTTAVAHMKEHGIYRERSQWHDELKAILDDRAQVMRWEGRINNQFMAVQRGTDKMTEDTKVAMLEALAPVKARYKAIDKALGLHINKSNDPLSEVLMSVPGVGSVITGALLAYVDLEKARHPSSLWAYTGLDKPKYARYEKGKAGGGNSTLRMIMWNFAHMSVEMNKSNPYRPVYDNTKARLSVSEKITKTNKAGQRGGIECMWKDTQPGHRQGAALRAVMKHFLADFWMVGREVRGLSTDTLYVEEYLGHDGIIKPWDRGWNRALVEAAARKNSLI